MLGWTNKQRFTKQNIATVPNTPINYKFFNGYGVPIYMGATKVGRHRLQSYYQEDCFKAHPTKKSLREEIKYFAWKPADNKKAALKLDRKHKYKHDYN